MPEQIAVEVAKALAAHLEAQRQPQGVTITVPKNGDSSVVAPSVARATSTQQAKKQRNRVVNAAKTPRDYIIEYLDENPNMEDRVVSDANFGYRELAQKIAARYGMDFDHTTVYRAVKKRKERAG